MTATDDLFSRALGADVPSPRPRSYGQQPTTRSVSALNSTQFAADTAWMGSGGHARPVGASGAANLQAAPVAVGASPFAVTTEDVLEVLGDDADSLLADSKLDMPELVALLNAETMLLPRIDARTEAEIEAALAGVAQDERDESPTKSKAGKHSAGVVPGVWKRRFLRAAIGAVLMSAVGGGTAFAMTKSVTVDVDGQQRDLNTFDSNVRDVLEAEGLQIGAHDVLSPSPDAPVSNGDKIVLDRGRQLTLDIDGVVQQHWVHTGTIGEALQKLRINTANAWLSDSPQAQVPLGGETVHIKSLKHITVVDGANNPRKLDTHASNVGELLKSLNINLAKSDSVNPGLKARLTDGAQVMISRTGTQVINLKRSIEAPVQQVEDDSMFQDDQKVVQQGSDGVEMVTYRVTKLNGEETKREQLAVKQLTAPKPRIIHVGTKQRPQAASSNAGTDVSNAALWDQIAECESSGNWAIDTGNGYYGGLQFDRQTWLGSGGGDYAPTANLATREQQITIANRVKAERGLQPWECAGKLGLY